MPKKSVEERLRRARAAGETATIKADDPGVAHEPLSPHAAKKSRYNVGQGHPSGRATSPRSAPHAGRMRRPPLEGEPEGALPPQGRVAALPREEREYEMIRQGHPDRLSPSGKKRGQP